MCVRICECCLQRVSACHHPNVRACMRACLYGAPENVFQSVFETVYVCFCFPF